LACQATISTLRNGHHQRHASDEFGLLVFDSSIVALGGRPCAKGATGDVATEDVVYLLHGLVADTGVDQNKIGRLWGVDLRSGEA